TSFPPLPFTDRDVRAVISKYCARMSPANFVEAGCAVCGWLTPLNELTRIKDYNGDLSLLVNE
ncbi:hypothetical protein C8F04DRAFT_921396, partial [Mycena alexandri]